MTKYEISQILHGYIRKTANGDKPLRSLNHGEVDLVLDLKRIEKETNVCITELCLAKEILKGMRDINCYWIITNLWRMIDSMVKQRKLVTGARQTLMRLAPNQMEYGSLISLRNEVRDRIKYLREVPVPENIRLTPLQDYVEIMNAESLSELMLKRWPIISDMVEVQRDPAALGLVCDEIMKVLKEHGRENSYVLRIQEYIQHRNEIREQYKQEKAEQKRNEALRESQNGIRIFMEKFFSSVRNHRTCDAIHLSNKCITEQINAGHRGDFCILSCGFYTGNYVYRFVQDDGKLINNFRHAGFYKTRDEALNMIESLKNKYSDHIFEAVEL